MDARTLSVPPEALHPTKSLRPVRMTRRSAFTRLGNHTGHEIERKTTISTKPKRAKAEAKANPALHVQVGGVRIPIWQKRGQRRRLLQSRATRALLCRQRQQLAYREKLRRPRSDQSDQSRRSC